MPENTPIVQIPPGEPTEQRKPKEPLLSRENRKLITDPLNDNNPVTVAVLGICSALAVTTQLKPSFVMGVSVIVVVSVSNLIISAIRKTVPDRIRMIVQLLVVAGLVTLVDQILKGFMYDVSKQLSVYIGLIITNCIVMGRLEAFAGHNKPWPSILDGIGNGVAFGMILVIMAFFRELFGAGKLFGFQVIPQFVYDMGYVNNGLMLTSAAGMFIIGILIWIQRSFNKKLIDVS